MHVNSSQCRIASKIFSLSGAKKYIINVYGTHTLLFYSTDLYVYAYSYLPEKLASTVNGIIPSGHKRSLCEVAPLL